ncbi:SNF2 family DNA or RNA helicase [Pseudarthrobacter sp. PvP004]|uniref:DEAD/DEAH box helicase n=1 Tax=Pseudarthrobacter sp. PvP004 TaxID=2817850 RepID=UPI001AE33682|nr:DEAD/DEAH box helicase [Pseudarthrobacter sp. PvP004]MBP2267041.1 SNF2 family DNA or RNA helicase [Pseudarthrobacter sp. PvP004]
MADWKIQEAQIFVFEQAIWRRATVREIAEAANSGQGLRHATGLRFGRIALAPEIVLRGALPDGVRVCVGVRRGAAFMPVPGLDAQGVIHESRWHPLDLAAVQACFAFLDKHELCQDSEISLGNYLAVKADPAGAGLLVDDTGLDDRATPAKLIRDFSALGLGIDLFPYQQVGAEFMVAMAERGVGVLLADQMGLGKTAQAIALLLDQRGRGPSLIVCPASLLRNWTREIGQVAPALTITTHAGPLRTGVASGLARHDVVITSYETLVSDMSFLSDIPWNVLALDEAQMIRNPETGRAQSVKGLSRRVSLALTGTPVENRLLDLWSIAEFVVPALLGSREAFDEAFPDELERAESLGQIIAPVTLRRLVADVATDLPELVHVETAFELPEDAKGRYAQIATASAGPLAAITALRVLCAHAEENDWGPGESAAPKAEHTMRIVAEAFSSGEKVLVFASFQQALDRMFEAVKARQPGAFLAVIDGRVPVPDRQTIIDLFTAFPGPGALFMNPQAAGVGLNITAANHVIHFNPEWNPALTSQATARAHRRKQTLPVTVHHLFYENTVEEDALLRSDWKRALARRVDDGAANTNEGPTA